MKKIGALMLTFVFLAVNSFISIPASAATKEKSVLYVMNYLSPETTTSKTLNDIKNSGFDSVIVFSIDGTSTGDLVFFGTPIFTNGNYVGPAGWTDKIKSLKTGSTSVTRLAFCLGGNYSTYRDYMKTNGTDATTNCYKNFAALKAMTGADAIDLNDENCYDDASTVQLGQMLNSIGYKVSLCPYTNSTHWKNVKTQLGSIVDAIHLQCYDGGAGNNVGTWNNYFGGLKVTPLFWTKHGDGTGDTYTTAQKKVRNWKASYGITSSGAWQYSDMRDYSGGTAAQFNAAIRAGLK